MKIIEKLSDHIKDEIEDAETYIRDAMACKEHDRDTADLYCDLAGEELKHMSRLHDRVVKVINDWRERTGQEPPPAMQARYDVLHQIHIGDANKVKLMIQLYKED